MRGSAVGGLLGGAAAALIFVVLPLLLTNDALAARGGTPGPPPPPTATPTPVPPCLSTAFLEGESVLGPPTILNNVEFTCGVRNVGVATHNVRIEIRNNVDTVIGTSSASLPPGGHFAAISLPAFGASCFVSTDEATVDALNDLAVLIQANDLNTAAVEGETEGKVYQHCAPAGLPGAEP